jgi:hypothetical protein
VENNNDFGNDWTEETENKAENANTLLYEVYLLTVSTEITLTSDTMISTEEGQPAKLLFWTADRITEFDQGRIVQACGPQSYTFNEEDKDGESIIPERSLL